MPDFVPFNDFKKRLDSSKFDEHLESMHAGIARVASRRALTANALGAAPPAAAPETEYERIRDFVQRHYEPATATHTFIDGSGNIVDCIPYDQHPAVVAAKKDGWELPEQPPAAAAPEGRRGAALYADTMDAGPQPATLVPPLRRGQVDLLGNKIACPPGSVPVRRITIDQIAHLGSLDNFFQKSPPARHAASAPAGVGAAAAPVQPRFTGPDGQTHQHAQADLSNSLQPGVVFHGSSSFLNLWKPNPAPGIMSLSQQWVINQSSNGFMQTVEAGWQVSPQWSTDDPVLFVFFTPDNYNADRSGYTTNRDLHGFVPWKDATPGWVLGGSFGQVSSPGGSQVGFQLQWQRDHSGNWWLYLGNSLADVGPIGFFPAGLFSTTAGPGPLTQGANVVAFGGEVAFSGASGGQMGSGLAPPPPPSSPLTAFGRVAFQNQVSTLQSVGGGLVPASLNWQNTGDSPPYSLAIGDDANWGTYFFFGGA